MSNLNQPHWAVYQQDPDASSSEFMAYRGQSLSWNYVFNLALHLKARRPSMMVGIRRYPCAIDPGHIAVEKLHIVFLHFIDIDPNWQNSDISLPPEDEVTEYPF